MSSPPYAINCMAYLFSCVVLWIAFLVMVIFIGVAGVVKFKLYHMLISIILLYFDLIKDL